MRANALQTTALQTTALRATAIGSDAPVARRRDADGAGRVTPTASSEIPDGQVSVLICDDRADVRLELSRVFRLRSQGAVESIGDGGALLQAYGATSPVQIMIGVHPGSNFGIDALELLLAHHPEALPVVYGSRRNIELLARVYARGAAGLLLWEVGNRQASGSSS